MIRILNNNQTSVSDEAGLVARLGNFFGWFTSTATAESESNILLTSIAATSGPSTPVEVAAVAHVALDSFGGSDVATKTKTGADSAAVAVSHSGHGSQAATGGAGTPVGPSTVVSTWMSVAELGIRFDFTSARVEALSDDVATTTSDRTVGPGRPGTPSASVIVAGSLLNKIIVAACVLSSSLLYASAACCAAGGPLRPESVVAVVVCASGAFKSNFVGTSVGDGSSLDAGAAADAAWRPLRWIIPTKAAFANTSFDTVAHKSGAEFIGAGADAGSCGDAIAAAC